MNNKVSFQIKKKKKSKVSLFLWCVSLSVLCLSFTSFKGNEKNQDMEKKNFYCEYCGKRFPDIRQLTSATCTRHPDGSHKGRHKLYEGSEKREYTCKYCGKKFPSIMVMTGGQCVNHPKGMNKGAHAPAL